MITTLENTPVEIDLLELGKTTGWSVDGVTATHESCNDGYIYLETFPLTAGESYIFSYQLSSISGGLMRPNLGTTLGTARTTAGFYVETLVAAGTDLRLSFYSNANCQVQILDIKSTVTSTSNSKESSIVFSPKSAKWTTFITYNPDCALSMFTNLFSYKAGLTYVHRPNEPSRNYFYGNQYQSTIKIVANQQPQAIKTFMSINLQNNKLMVTTTDGIETNLGQVSELIDQDFLRDLLDDGVSEVNVYSKEGIYAANFMKDKNSGGIIEGDNLKGNWASIELITVETGILKLFTVSIHSVPSKNGIDNR